MAVLRPGDEVRITTGPYRGSLAGVEAVDSERARATVVVTVFGRQTRLEFDDSQMERL